MNALRAFLLVAIPFCTSCTAIEKCEPDSLECVLADFANDKHKDLHSVVVIQSSELVTEQYYHGGTRETLVDVRSAGKSVTSLLFGIALDKKFIASTDEYVAEYLIEAKDKPIGKVRFDHLLTMRTGLDADSNDPESVGNEDNMDASDDPFALVLTVPNKTEAGTQYVYNSLAAYVTGVVIGNATGKGLEPFAHENLFDPLNIKHWDWQEGGSGYTKGQGNLFLTALDFARIGQMVLNDGQYNGKQIVSRAWIEESLKPRVDVSKIEFNAVGYGYYWFYQEYEINGRSIEVHFASGNGGNKIYIIPDYDMVVSIMSLAYGQGRGQRRSENILKAILSSQTL